MPCYNNKHQCACVRINPNQILPCLSISHCAVRMREVWHHFNGIILRQKLQFCRIHYWLNNLECDHQRAARIIFLHIFNLCIYLNYHLLTIGFDILCLKKIIYSIMGVGIDSPISPVQDFVL